MLRYAVPSSVVRIILTKRVFHPFIHKLSRFIVGILTNYSIGMVTMQYQAQTDIVALIERLERACIRFVHFSKENELRSRVFSEKMGLESGWNCHISLLSDEHSLAVSPHIMSRNFDEPNRGLSEPDILNIDHESTEMHQLLPQPL